MSVINLDIKKVDNSNLLEFIQNAISIRLATNSILLFCKENKIDITSEELYILLILKFSKQLNQTQINNILKINKTTAGRMYDNLETLDLIERKITPSNKRQKLLFLTKKGIKLIRTIKMLKIED